MSEFENLDRRSREIFQRIVESYLASGIPIGSQFLAKGLSEKISPATVRNVMAALETKGLLGSPHISAGRLPTERGLRFFVDGMLEIKTLSEIDQNQIENAMRSLRDEDSRKDTFFERTGTMFSEISKTASLVYSKKRDSKIQQIDFVMLSAEQALVILVDENGEVDNRLFTPPKGMTASELAKAANFINAQIENSTLCDMQTLLESAISRQKEQIDERMKELIDIGRAAMVEGKGEMQLVVRGRSHLFDERHNDEDIEILRELMDDLEEKKDLVDLLELSSQAEAVRVFIGSENKLFSMKSSSLVVSPYMNSEGKIIGALGVIGPTRLNYARIVPMVSYTANLIGKMIENEDGYER